MEIFRRNNVRFIAINNGIDSQDQNTLEFAPFINIMSEWYARDISKKVKTGIKTKGANGKRFFVSYYVLIVCVKLQHSRENAPIANDKLCKLEQISLEN